MGMLEGLLYPVAATVLAATILGLWKLVQTKLDDRILLEASLSQPGSQETMQRIGCACMIVTIANKGNRVAKIRRAVIALKGTDLLPRLEEGFGESFGHFPVEGGPPEVLVAELFPLREPDSVDGFVLDRDDAVKFAMPIQGVPLLHKFPEAPSLNVWIAVKHFDESETIVLQGLTIQNMIRDLITVWSDEVQTLKINPKIEIRALSAVPLANTSVIGKTNPHPIRFTDEQPKSRNTFKFTFPVFAITSKDASRAALMSSNHGWLMPLFATREAADDKASVFADDGAVVEFQEATELLEFVEHPPYTVEKGPPVFDIAFDVLDPEEGQLAVVKRENFIEFLKNLQPINTAE